jgi:hypothetical protein
LVAYSVSSLTRTLQTCQAFGAQRRTFVEEEVWKTLPWKDTPKNAEDQIVDILVDLPGLGEDVVSPQNHASCQEKIGILISRLRAWRWDWEAAHSGTVREVPYRVEMAGIETDVFKELLSTSLEFESLTRALEILMYNAALLYLMQLEAAARGGTAEPESLSDDENAYIRRVAALRRVNSPLLLPGEPKFLCQPAIEAFRVMPCITKLLTTTTEKETLITLAPLGIMYWVLQGQPELSCCLDSMLGGIPTFGNAQKVFKGYRVSVMPAENTGLAGACQPNRNE